MRHLLRQGDAKVFKKYSQMKLQKKREALQKLDRQANECPSGFGTEEVKCSVLSRFRHRRSDLGAILAAVFMSRMLEVV